MSGSPSDPYHLEIWGMDQGLPRVQDAWASNPAGAFELLSTWAQKDNHYRLKLYYHAGPSRGSRVHICTYDRAGVITDPDGEYEPSKKDLGVEIGHLLKNTGDGVGELFGAFLENQAKSDSGPDLDGIGEGLGELIAGIFEGLGNG